MVQSSATPQNWWSGITHTHTHTHLERLQKRVEVYEDDLRDLVFARVDEEEHVGDSQQGEEDERGLHCFPAAEDQRIRGRPWHLQALWWFSARRRRRTLHQSSGTHELLKLRKVLSKTKSVPGSEVFTCTGSSPTWWRLEVWSSGSWRCWRGRWSWSAGNDKIFFRLHGKTNKTTESAQGETWGSIDMKTITLHWSVPQKHKWRTATCEELQLLF